MQRAERMYAHTSSCAVGGAVEPVTPGACSNVPFCWSVCDAGRANQHCPELQTASTHHWEAFILLCMGRGCCRWGKGNYWMGHTVLAAEVAHPEQGRCRACHLLSLDMTSLRIMSAYREMKDAYMCRLTQRRIPRVCDSHQTGAVIDHVEGRKIAILDADGGGIRELSSLRGVHYRRGKSGRGTCESHRKRQ
jgi:hypothetical protein